MVYTIKINNYSYKPSNYGFNVDPLNLTWSRAYRIEVKPLRDRLLLYKEHGRCPGVVSTFAHHRVSYDGVLFIYMG